MPTINKKPIILISPQREKIKFRQKFYASTRWRQLSKLYRKFNPLCQDCLENNIVKEAIDIHHIKSPFENGLSDAQRWERMLDWNNLRSLCKECHQRNHQEKLKKKSK